MIRLLLSQDVKTSKFIEERQFSMVVIFVSEEVGGKIQRGTEEYDWCEFCVAIDRNMRSGKVGRKISVSGTTEEPALKKLHHSYKDTV
jgi:hypothetical protein